MEWWSSGSSGCEGSGPDESSQELRRAITAGNLLESEGRLRTVRRLDLSLAALEKVPAPLEHCTRLNELSLRSNRLEALPKWLSRLQALRNLNLAGNRLQHFPPELLDLQNLK
jgi:Leucine-rich repeat (LRR) protein